MPPKVTLIKGGDLPDQKQSVHPELPKLPCRKLLIAPSSGFKTTCVLDELMKLYVDSEGKPLFKRVFWFSKTCKGDPKLQILEKWCEKKLKQPLDTEPVLYDEWDPKVVAKLLDETLQVAEFCKKKGKAPPPVAWICDDMSEDRKVSRGSQLASLYLRGRHAGISTWVCSQSYRLLSPEIRKNAMSLYVGPLRSKKEQEAIAEENSAMVPGGIKQVEEIIRETTTKTPHNFLFIDLNATEKGEIFHDAYLPIDV